MSYRWPGSVDRVAANIARKGVFGSNNYNHIDKQAMSKRRTVDTPVVHVAGFLNGLLGIDTSGAKLIELRGRALRHLQ